MATEVIVYVCASAEQAVTARQFLITGGYTPDEIIVAEPVARFIYDAATHEGGGSERHFDEWIVIGRR